MAKNNIGRYGATIRCEKHLGNFQVHGKKIEIWKFRSYFVNDQHKEVWNYGVFCDGVGLGAWAKTHEELTANICRKIQYRLTDEDICNEIRMKSEVAMAKLSRESLEEYIQLSKEYRKAMN